MWPSSSQHTHTHTHEPVHNAHDYYVRVSVCAIVRNKTCYCYHSGASQQTAHRCVVYPFMHKQHATHTNIIYIALCIFVNASSGMSLITGQIICSVVSVCVCDVRFGRCVNLLWLIPGDTRVRQMMSQPLCPRPSIACVVALCG